MINRFEANDIAKASSIPGQFFIRIRPNSGLSHYDGLPFVATCPYHITEEEYSRRQQAKWPPATRGMIVVGEQPQVQELPEEITPARSATPQTTPVLSTGTLGEVLRPRKNGDEK